MRSITLENETISITILPEAGGKIWSLRNRNTGREWLWHNPHLPLKPPAYGASYVETMDCGGWDEIFPSVSPCELDGLTIPDHGDLVALKCEVVELKCDRLKTRVRTRFAECLFERTLQIKHNRLRVEYRVSNLTKHPTPYLWCAHPLIAIEPGMSIVLPEQTPMLSRGGVNIPETASFPWPSLSPVMRLDTIPDPGNADFTPYAIKMFSAKASTSQVEIKSADGSESFLLAWNPADLPHLGMWLNAGAWSGCGSSPYFNLGLEPSTAAYDSLADALAVGDAHILPPGESRTWQLEIALIDH